MQIHELRRTTKHKSRKRVGRGGKRGTFSGRGTKGQKARSGHRIRPEIRDVIKKLPKKRGYAVPSLGVKVSVVNVGDLENAFNASDVITPKALIDKGLMEARGGHIPAVKILGAGDVSKKFTVKGCRVSESAMTKIKKAGGNVE